MDISIRPGLNIENKDGVVYQYPDQKVYPYHQIIVYIIYNVPYVLIYEVHIHIGIAPIAQLVTSSVQVEGSILTAGKRLSLKNLNVIIRAIN